MSENDIIDRIDALVDEQLANYGNRSGYDHNVNEERCRCGRDWHGLPITKHIDRMRAAGRFDPAYSYADDQTLVMCVGSTVLGPWRKSGYDPIWQLPDDPFPDFQRRYFMGVSPQPHVRYWNADLTEVRNADIEAFSTAPLTRVEWRSPEPLSWAGHFPGAEMQSHFEALAAAARRVGEQFSAIRDAYIDEPEPDTRTPQQRALPQPSTTPPMWANDPTRSRRPRRGRNQPTRQGIA